MNILDEKYNLLFKKDYKDILEDKIIKNKDILVGNYVFNIFNYNLNIKLDDYEIFSINENNDHGLKDIIRTYNIVYYNNKIYTIQ